MNPLEKTILRQLFADKQYAERVVPYLQERYFHSSEAATIYKLFYAFFEKFRVPPHFSAIRIGLDSVQTLTEREAKAAQEVLTDVENAAPLDESQAPWLLEQSELFCQDRAVYCALQDCIKVMDDPKQSRHVIPDLMKQALAVSFDTKLGHNYFREALDRYDFYHKPETKLAFDLDTFNKLTNGGVPRKTLNVVLAGTNVGKSLALVHFASAYVRMGKKVLYITCEMAEEWIGQRTDANMMDIPMDDVLLLSRLDYERKINHLRQSSAGELVIREYPTGTATVAHFRTLLQELRLKENFTPDVIIVDYLSICASSRVKVGNSVNSYMFNKYIAEELRGLAQEYDVPLWTAAQFNREGFKSTDPGLEHVGESFGIPQTADFCFALVSTEELEKVGQIACIELKNRYNRKKTYQQHLFGFDTPRMKIYELSAAQKAAAISLPTTAPTPAQQTAPSVSNFSNRRRKPLQSLRNENTNATSP